MTAPILPTLSGFYTFNGIQVAAIGEDGDFYVALGHHDPHDTLAAFNAYSRWLIGEELPEVESNDLVNWTRALSRVKPDWATLRTACDQADEDDHEPDCSECERITEHEWFLETGLLAPENPDGTVFPVMVWVS